MLLAVLGAGCIVPLAMQVIERNSDDFSTIEELLGEHPDSTQLEMVAGIDCDDDDIEAQREEGDEDDEDVDEDHDSMVNWKLAIGNGKLSC